MRFLVIEGNIGAGKTTLAGMIAREFNAKLILEQFADNPFLPKFYENPDRYSFPLELSFLADRYHQIKKEVLNLDLFHPFLVADYFFVKSSETTFPSSSVMIRFRYLITLSSWVAKMKVVLRSSFNFSIVWRMW